MRFDGGYLLDKYIFHTAYSWNDFCVCVTGYVECQTDNQITLFGDYSVQFLNMEELNIIHKSNFSTYFLMRFVGGIGAKW